MYKLFFLAIFFPVFVFSQTKNINTPASKAAVKPSDGFIINGEVSGYNNGTVIVLLNAQTGVPENAGSYK
ncbi:MAG: hypothetical protein IPJ81_04045 [Chitinophagaceae bacterium]|nr:hypothetical protein [Chitinophagaceae bacterium]